MLAGITTEPLDDDMRRKTGMVADILHNSKQPFVTTITLTGPDEALDSAERAMRHSFPSKVFKLERDGEVLQVMMCGDQHGDPAKLVAMVQNKTRCLLPMEINPCTAPCATVPEHFNPALETELWDEVPKKQRASTGTALAGYVGMQFPSYSLMLPERALHNKYVKSNARVVVNEPHRSEGDALTVAEHLKEGVEARMTRGQRPEFH